MGSLMPSSSGGSGRDKDIKGCASVGADGACGIFREPGELGERVRSFHSR